MAYAVHAGLFWYLQVISMYADVHDLSGAVMIAARKVQRSSNSRGYEVSAGSVIKRELKAMKGLRVMAGKSFYFDKQLILNFVDIVLGQAVNALIMY